MSTMTLQSPTSPRWHVREGTRPSPREQSPVSPRRRVPSPLRHAEFRPLAMEYAQTPQPTSCKYFNNTHEEDEVGPGETPGGYCSTFRTVGYSTVGGKTFMSGKCPYCKRTVKSDTQVCTPNATPPPSPWKVSLQSPLRSPLRTSPKDGQTSLQSPLRSPFKGAFFGANDDDDDDSNKTPSPKPAARGRRSRSPGPRSPVRSSPLGTSSPGPWSPLRSPPATGSTRGSNSLRPCSPLRSPTTPGTSSTRGPNSPGPRSPIRSPWRRKGAFFGGSKDEEALSKPIGKSRGAHSPGPRSPLRVKVAFFGGSREEAEQESEEERVGAAGKSKQGGGRDWRSPLRSPFKGSFFGGGGAKSGGERGRTPVGSE